MMSTETTEFTTLESLPKPPSDTKLRLKPALGTNVSPEQEHASSSNLVILSDVDQVKGYSNIYLKYNGTQPDYNWHYSSALVPRSVMCRNRKVP